MPLNIVWKWKNSEHNHAYFPNSDILNQISLLNAIFKQVIKAYKWGFRWVFEKCEFEKKCKIGF